MFERVFEKVKKLGDLFLTFDVKEIFYLTKFQLSFGVVLLSSKGDKLLLTDKRYLTAAKSKVKNFKVIEWKGFESLKEIIENKNVVVDGKRINVSMFNKLSNYTNLKVVDGFLDEFRVIKSDEEISLISRAVVIAEQSLRDVLHLLKPGITEYQFRKALVERMFHYGCEEAFETIVASGPNSAVPHHKTGTREIKNGDAVVIDFGVNFKGYVSDITRTFLVGDVPSDLKNIYETVLNAQILGIEKAYAGNSCKSVDTAVGNYIKEKGYGEFFTHGTGHGIGVEVHEAPTLSFKSDEILQKSSVVTVEPGIYIPELGGVRIEDDVLVTDTTGYSLVTLEK